LTVSCLGCILQLTLQVRVNSELRQCQDSAPVSSSEVHSTDISKETSNPEG